MDDAARLRALELVRHRLDQLMTECLMGHLTDAQVDQYIVLCEQERVLLHPSNPPAA